MAKSAPNPTVSAYLSKVKKWQTELRMLRTIVLGCGLKEELKWGKPCYTFQESNVAVLFGFKEYCAVGFFKGALLEDPKNILASPGKNSQAMRQIRFTDAGEIAKMKKTLESYIYQAIEIEKAGLKVNFKQKVVIPEEFQNRLNKNRALKAAFEALTPGRQRAYALYFSAAKHPQTREARVEKHISRILGGKGLND